MRMRSAQYLIVTLLAAASMMAQAATPTSGAREYVIEPAPSWVDTNQPAIADSGAKEAPDGVEFVVVDRQLRYTERAAETYSHIVQRVVTEAGVAEASTLTIEFDPHSEQLSLHRLHVQRGGRTLDQLNVAHTSVLRRESNLESGLLDGNLTLSIVLEDIRPGDFIAYSYTRRFYDPVLGPRFVDTFVTQWSTPVRWSRVRLVRAANRKLRIEQIGDEVPARVERRAEWLETTWEWRDLSAIPAESDRPSWHIGRPRLRITDWSSWAEVVDWAVPLYRSGSLSAPMRQLIDEWSDSAADEADRIVLALRFVQDQVRYTGLEIGPGAYQPTDPARVLDRRYGDCKDKVLLLVAMLRAMGIDARPVLVNTELQHEVTNALPSPRAFDHVIARVRSGGKTYWFDATRTLQGGKLATIDQASFGVGLVIEPGVTALQPIAATVTKDPTTDVTETFDLKAGVAAVGKFNVTSVYRGADADTIRHDLQSSTLEELGRRYFDFYREWYPGIKALGPPQARDDRDNNRVEISEAYEIEPAFAVQDDGTVRFDVNPHVVADKVKAPRDIHRTTPLAVSHPEHVRYKSVVLLPEDWQVQTGVTTVEDPAFRYRADLTYRTRRFEAIYEFRTLADHVEAARAPEYARKLEQVRDDASYWFTHSGKARLPPPRAINLVALLAIVMGLAGGGAFVSYLIRRGPSITKPAPDRAPVGIRGWLLLPALQTCALPVVAGLLVFQYWPYLNAHTWNDIGAGQGELAIQLLKLSQFLLMSIACALVVASCGGVYLLFGRRRAYPVCFIALTWSVLLWVILDTIIAAYMPDGEQPSKKDIAEIVRDCISAALWTAYMFKSARVAATFVRQPVVRAPEAAVVESVSA
jgi:transglutaminase-like putative cysteine protease